jgi:RNA polymerase sigma-70 factor (ECF subfamily)
MTFSGNYHCVTEAEFQRLFDEHKDAVYRFAWRMTSTAAVAEDIAQDVFLTLLRQPQRFDPSRGTMRAFLLGVARNIALKRWRDEERWEELGDAEFVGQPTKPLCVDHMERTEIAERVGNAVRSLAPLQREVLILAEYEGLSLEEIARAVESEVGTVKSRLHRARENLKQMLAPLRSYQPAIGGRPAKHGTIR